MRAIDADALIEKCGGWYVDECTESGFIGTLENLLATEPTIQPQSTTGQLNDGAQSTARSTDLIDRQAAIDAIEKMNIPEDMCVFEILSHIEVEIATLPTIQPEPKEGEWEQISAQRYFMSASYFYRCSACGVNNVRNTNFCPNCGAKMTISTK